MNPSHALFVGGVAFALALAVTPIVRVVARRYAFVARPRSDRWHVAPTALGGGIAVLLATVGGVLCVAPLPTPLAILLLTSAGAFVVGLADDIATFRVSTKLTLQVVLASLALAGGVRLDWTGSLTADSLLTVLWLIGLTNAFNFIDNMDGACAGLGAIAATAIAIAGLMLPGAAGPEVALAAAVGGALAGFLVYNYHPASVFLGDSGSLFVGFLLAGLTADIGGAARSLPTAVVALPVLVLLVPIFDTTLVTVARKLSGRPASQGGMDHTAHRLVALGFSETKAVLFLYAMALASAGGAVALIEMRPGSDVFLALLSVAVVLLALALLQVRVYGGQDFSLLLGWRPGMALLGSLLRHSVFELLLDLVLITTSYYAAYRIRFDGGQLAQFFPTFLESLPILLACKIVCLRVFGVYGGLWKYFSTSDVVPMLKAVGAGSILSVMAFAYVYRFERISRSVLIIDALLLAILLVGTRLVFRLLPVMGGGSRDAVARAVAYGAGDAGEMLARELLNNHRYSYRLVAFIDDDPVKRGRRIRGVPVVGGLEALDGLLTSGVEAVILTSTALAPSLVQRVRAACTAASVRLLRFSCVLEEVGVRVGIRAEPAAAVVTAAASSGRPKGRSIRPWPPVNQSTDGRKM